MVPASPTAPDSGSVQAAGSSQNSGATGQDTTGSGAGSSKAQTTAGASSGTGKAVTTTSTPASSASNATATSPATGTATSSSSAKYQTSSTEHQGHSVKTKGIAEEAEEFSQEAAKAVAAQFSHNQFWAQMAYGGGDGSYAATAQLIRYI